jgi:periplasmic protein TonB
VRIFVALFLSVALHLSMFFYFSYHKKDQLEIEKQKPSKTHITYAKLINQHNKIEKKATQSNQPKRKKEDNPPQNLPKIIEIPPVQKNQKLFELPAQKESKPQIIKQPEVKPQPIPETKKSDTPKELPKEEKGKTSQQPIDKITQSYLELYKDDFENFPSETKIYLIKNLKDIGKITQRYLIYPYIAIQAKQSGINVVEFILYPNGKITQPKILKSSKYYILDDNSIETIQQAYMDYPRPDKPTIIRIYVKYELI